ncbi:hypothetical protein DQF30_23705 [Shigella flexneri]|nr:hypothetical protein [Shigella flexneri]PLA41487.1 hypothetical protein CYJ94_11130 [Micrococcus luteus]TFU79993.1 hypothetical protein E4T87_10875 [Micrococcus aloeverae]
MRSGHRDDSIRGCCERFTRRITRWPRPRLRRRARPPGATPLCGTQLSLERVGERQGFSAGTVRNHLIAAGVALRDPQGRDR